MADVIKRPGDTVTVSGTITNTGNMDVNVIITCYSIEYGALGSSDFISLSPGASQYFTFSFTVPTNMVERSSLYLRVEDATGEILWDDYTGYDLVKGYKAVEITAITVS
ncbi:MAG: hypothetical protein NDF54_07375 [archaeon GB-1867-035]|nr:hypothetical protein [Candidatus Culexmicrobium profundum]